MRKIERSKEILYGYTNKPYIKGSTHDFYIWGLISFETLRSVHVKTTVEKKEDHSEEGSESTNKVPV